MVIWVVEFPSEEYKIKYKGFLPNATFGPGEKLHQPNFALALYEFWAIYFISAIFWLLFAQKIAPMKKLPKICIRPIFMEFFEKLMKFP